MSKPMWGATSKKVERTSRKNHIPVLAPAEQIEKDRIPSFGPIAIAPLDTAMAKSGLDYIVADLSDIEGIQLQKGADHINEDTRGIVWLDASGDQVNLLDELLTKYKNVGWIQLPMAGINKYSPLVEKYSHKVWTSAKVSNASSYRCVMSCSCLLIREHMHNLLQSTHWRSP
jgi:hypothetical protein